MYRRGRLVGIVPWETSFTDTVLLSIATQFPGRVIASRFEAAREAATGADWQWWFRDRTGFAGMRVQAKRRNPRTGGLGLKAMAPAPPAGERQARRLVRQGAADGLTAFYCFYGDRPPYGAAAASTGPCPHGPLDPDQWGVSLLLAQEAVRHAEDPSPIGRARMDAIAAATDPWWRLVCPGVADSNESTVTAVSLFIRRAAAVELARRMEDPDLPDPDDLEIGEFANPPIGSEPPPDIRRAFDTRSLDEFDPPAGLSGIALFDAR